MNNTIHWREKHKLLKIQKFCLSCNVPTENKYCSIACQHKYQRDEKVAKGIASAKTLKRFIIDEKGNRCYTCGITQWNDKPIVFELEHIDGNSENNSLDNLELICPNCHSQTATYKGANKGSGRHYRRQRYAEGKSY